MEITVKGESKEIAALVVVIQERQDIDRLTNENLQSFRQTVNQAIIFACASNKTM